MYSKIKLAGHPIHPMLIAFPVAFYAATLVCYIVYNSSMDLFWFKVAYVANAAGVIMALVAAVPGFLDWLFIPTGSRPKKTGLFHMICNVTALLLYGICILQLKDKWDDPNPDMGMAIFLTGAGFVITLVAGFLGWTLVQKYHVGVDPLTDEEVLSETRK